MLLATYERIGFSQHRTSLLFALIHLALYSGTQETKKKKKKKDHVINFRADRMKNFRVGFLFVCLGRFFSCSADRQADLRSNKTVKRNERVRKKNTTKLAEYRQQQRQRPKKKTVNSQQPKKKWAFCVYTEK